MRKRERGRVGDSASGWTAAELKRVSRARFGVQLSEEDARKLAPLVRAVFDEVRALDVFDCPEAEPQTEFRLELWPRE